jgi:hypothetical protein
MLSPPVSEMCFASPDIPLAFTTHFLSGWGSTQHKLSTTNLSPAEETLKNAADAVDRMKELKTFKNPEPTTVSR